LAFPRRSIRLLIFKPSRKKIEERKSVAFI
jgi:hypothetical protein